MGDRLQLGVDISSIKGIGGVFAGGLEFNPPVGSSNWLALRGGYNTRKNEAEDLSGASFGVGLLLGPVRLDYAWIPLGELGNSHAAGFVWDFPVWGDLTGPKPIQVEEPAGKEELLQKVTPSGYPYVIITLSSGKIIEGEVIQEIERLRGGLVGK